jgi:hypothetical protein
MELMTRRTWGLILKVIRMVEEIVTQLRNLGKKFK